MNTFFIFDNVNKIKNVKIIAKTGTEIYLQGDLAVHILSYSTKEKIKMSDFRKKREKAKFYSLILPT